MSLHLDHAVIAVHDLDAAIHDYRRLGFTVIRGGVHANRATHNALITFANGTYLELLAATHETPLPGLVDFSIMLQSGEGLVGFALRADDLDAVQQRAHDDFAVGSIIPGERRRTDGTLVQWKLTLLDDAFAPFLIQDVSPQEHRIPTDPAVTTHANTARGLRGIEVAVRDLPDARARYARLFGLSPQGETVGDVFLREATEAHSLVGLHLALDNAEQHRFPLEQTHGVHFFTG